MGPEKLNREQHHEINANQGDQIRFWDGFNDKQNLTVRAKTGDDVLTVYGLTRDQLGELYLDIGQLLGKPPEPTLHHLQQMHATIGKLIQAKSPDDGE